MSMRLLLCTLCVGVLGFLAAGCTPRATYTGPKNDSFTGRLVHNGEPVSFPPGETVWLYLIFHDKGRPFNIRIDPDGKFKIGWMPIGKYSVSLQREMKVDVGVAQVGQVRIRGQGQGGYALPDLVIEDGKTDYTIELGKDWKP
jgi:hypothetical protein